MNAEAQGQGLVDKKVQRSLTEVWLSRASLSTSGHILEGKVVTVPLHLSSPSFFFFSLLNVLCCTRVWLINNVLIVSGGPVPLLALHLFIALFYQESYLLRLV